MSPKTTVGIIATAIALLAPISPSIAAGNLVKIQVCSSFPHPIEFSMAYASTDAGDYISRGWNRIESGYCYYFDNAIHVPQFYYRAQSLPYRQKGRSVQETWGDKGTNLKSFCIAKSFNARYNYWEADSKADCGRSDSFVPFQFVAGGGSDLDRTYTLTFGADGTSISVYNPVKPSPVPVNPNTPPPQ